MYSPAQQQHKGAYVETVFVYSCWSAFIPLQQRLSEPNWSCMNMKPLVDVSMWTDRSDVHLKLTAGCFLTPVRSPWPLQDPFATAHVIWETCQPCFQSVSITSVLHICVLWPDLDWIIFQAIDQIKKDVHASVRSTVQQHRQWWFLLVPCSIWCYKTHSKMPKCF